MLELSPLFSSQCVLPMGRELRIFGKSDDTAPVCCRITDARGNMLTQGSASVTGGRFLVRMAPIAEAHTDTVLTVCQGSASVICDHVAIGLVFLAGGQSNM